MDIKRILQGIEVDDNHILLSKPKETNIAGLDIMINQVNYYYDWDDFSLHFGTFINCYNKVCETFTLPDTLEDMEQFKKNIAMVLKNTAWGKDAFKNLIKSCEYSIVGDMRLIKKRFTSDDWIELFSWVYLYNILGVKKNLYHVLKVVSKVQFH